MTTCKKSGPPATAASFHAAAAAPEGRAGVAHPVIVDSPVEAAAGGSQVFGPQPPPGRPAEEAAREPVVRVGVHRASLRRAGRAVSQDLGSIRPRPIVPSEK